MSVAAGALAWALAVRGACGSLSHGGLRNLIRNLIPSQGSTSALLRQLPLCSALLTSDCKRRHHTDIHVAIDLGTFEKRGRRQSKQDDNAMGGGKQSIKRVEAKMGQTK